MSEPIAHRKSASSRTKSPLVLVPIGAFEQHGPHLPFDTDTRIAVALAREAIRMMTDEGISTVEAPAIAISASDEHQGFIGTLSIGTETSADVLVALARSATWARGVIFVNGHGGNSDAITRATAELLNLEVRHQFWSVSGYSENDSHAGFAETSLMLHLAPEDVNLEKIEIGNTDPLSTLLPVMRVDGVRAVSANGVLGDPRGASKEHGHDLFKRNLAALAQAVKKCDENWT